MKQQSGKDLMLQCGTGLVSTFIQSGLIDEYRIGVIPIILGAGNSLSEALKDKLKLLKTKTFNSGLVLLHYQLA
jgi:dihydrofolate reductase